MQHLEQVPQAVDVAVVVGRAGEDVGKVDHSDLHVGHLPRLVPASVRLRVAVPCAVVLLALHAALLVQGVDAGEALLDVVVVLQNAFVLLQAPGAGFLLRRRGKPLVDEEERAGVKVQLALVLEPAKDALDLGDACGDNILAEEVAVVEEFTQSCSEETELEYGGKAV